MVQVVKKGKFHSNLFWSFISLTCKKAITFNMTLLEGWNYPYRNSDDKDTSKLLRISDNIHHYLDSIGLGISKEKDGSLFFRTMVHRDSKKINVKICKAEIYKKYKCKLFIGETKYYIKVGNKRVAVERTSNYKGPRYILGVRAGGDLRASQDLKTEIKIL